MNKFEAGQKVVITGDSFESDPHKFEIGSVYTIEQIQPATKVEDFPDFIKLLYVMDGKEMVDLPERALVRNEEGEHANVVFDDLELVGSVKPKSVRLLENDEEGGFSVGDVFPIQKDLLEGDYFFDLDGDARQIEVFAHEKI